MSELEIKYVFLGSKRKKEYRCRVYDKVIEIQCGLHWVKISRGDFKKIKPYRVHVVHNGFDRYYARISIAGKSQPLAHFLIGEEAEYINGDTLDCTRNNLTNREGYYPRKAHRNNSSGYCGVSWTRSTGKWGAFIWQDGKNINLGYYDFLEAAKNARREGEKRYLGRRVSIY